VSGGQVGEGRPAGDPTVPLPTSGSGYGPGYGSGYGPGDRSGYGGRDYASPGYPPGGAAPGYPPGYDLPGYGPPGYERPGYDTAGRRGAGRGGRPRRRAFRLLRRAVLVLLALILAGAAAFGALLVVTPSVGNARALVRADNRRHHAVYPGPPVPPRFAAALEATEDHRFNEEPGVDPIAVARVALGWLTGHGDQGGATLYQQLAKVLYTPDRSGLAVEAEQVALAVKLKFSYSGAQILRMYASVVYFGHGFYGIAAASCGYFGTTPAGMSWPQAALLAGLVQGPTVDDPLDFPAAARAREVHVIGRLVATGALTRARAAEALAVPLSGLVARAGQGCPA
jgi:membrane peptidoglycan carboxypeptidase